MTLRELAQRFSKEYQFRVFNAAGNCLGTFDRNEIVKLEYVIGQRKVYDYFAKMPSTLIQVVIDDTYTTL